MTKQIKTLSSDQLLKLWDKHLSSRAIPNYLEFAREVEQEITLLHTSDGAYAKQLEEDKDSKRYKWLRNDDAQYIATVRIYQHIIDSWSSLTQDELDNAIDAAMQQEGQP